MLVSLEIMCADLIFFAVSIARSKNINERSVAVKKIISYANSDGRE